MLYATDINTDGNKLDSKKDGFWVGLSTDDVINLKHQGVGLKMNSPLRLCEQPLTTYWGCSRRKDRERVLLDLSRRYCIYLRIQNHIVSVAGPELHQVRRRVPEAEHGLGAPQLVLSELLLPNVPGGGAVTRPAWRGGNVNQSIYEHLGHLRLSFPNHRDGFGKNVWYKQ